MDAFRARMDARSDPEATLAIKQYSIEQVAFASAVHSCHGDDSNWPFDVIQKFDGIRVNFKSWSDSMNKHQISQNEQSRGDFTYC